MNQESGYFLYFAFFPDTLVDNVKRDDHISEHEGMLVGLPTVSLDPGRIGRRKGQHVRGKIFLAPLAVQILDESIVTEDDGELTFFQA